MGVIELTVHKICRLRLADGHAPEELMNSALSNKFESRSILPRERLRIGIRCGYIQKISELPKQLPSGKLELVEVTKELINYV